MQLIIGGVEKEGPANDTVWKRLEDTSAPEDLIAVVKVTRFLFHPVGVGPQKE
jgi:hypothetical protein